MQKSCAQKTKGAEVAPIRDVMMMRSHCMRFFSQPVLALAAMALPRVLAGQATPPARDTQKVAVVIFAEATAGEVSFKAQPRLHVRLSGGLDSVHVLDG